MRLKREPPKEEIVVVDMAPEGERQPMCKLYKTTQTEIGEVQYDREGKMWTTDNGLQFRHSKHMIQYYEERLRQRGRELPPGQYSVTAREVRQSPDRLIIRTAEGAEIIINYRGT